MFILIRTIRIASRPVAMSLNFASLLALLPMLLHSILGCCWHHAHQSSCGPGNYGPGNTKTICQSSVELPAGTHTDHAASPCHNHEHGTSSSEELPPDECPTNKRPCDKCPEDKYPGEPCPESPCDEGQCLFASTSTGVAPQMFSLESAWCNFFVAIVEQSASAGSPIAASHEFLDGRLSGSAGQCRALTQVWLI